MRVENLYQHLKHRYPLKKEIIPLTSRQIAMTIVEDGDKFLDELSREDSDGDLHLPYWTYLWPSAIGLVHYLDEMETLAGHQILEIGCGFGLAGIVACQNGGRVFFTDYERDALRFAQYNVLQNGCEQNAAFVQMDWHAPCLKRQFSRILASDVIYEERNWQPILALIEKYLTPDGRAIFSEPNRTNADGFFDLIRHHGFTYEEYGYTVLLLAEDSSTVTVYCVRRI